MESLVRRRGARHGVRRLEHELAEHQLGGEASAAALAAFRRAEPDLAWQAWQRRFGVAPTDAAERARQQRFLAARGFRPDSVAEVFRRLRAAERDPSPGGNPGSLPD